MTPVAGPDELRDAVGVWCKDQTPADWRQQQTDGHDDACVRFQKWWFAELHSAGFAVPHWDSGIHVYLKRASLNRSLFGRQRATENYALKGIYR